MPRRRRFTKVKKSAKRSGGDPDAPSDADWEKMQAYGSFVVMDDENEQHTFRVNDHALVFPPNYKVGTELELYEFWVVKIRDIRAYDQEVWARVQWYYSGQDVANVIKHFDPTTCGKYERIFSDHFDYISSLAFDGVTTVKKYNEADLQQEAIGEEEFYCRYTLEYNARRIDPKPGVDTCICKLPYSPDDDSTLMHFCPRPSCCKAYHQNCLIKAKFKDPTLSNRKLRLLNSSPDSDGVFVLTDLGTAEVPKKRKLGSNKNNDALPPPSQSQADLLTSLPPGIVEVAQHPIIKGAKFRAGGVAGNIKAVALARRTVYDAIRGTPVPYDWEEVVDVDAALFRGIGNRKLPALICPQCESPI